MSHLWHWLWIFGPPVIYGIIRAFRDDEDDDED